MPPPSETKHLPPTHPAQRQPPKSPTRVLAEAEAQWIFSEAELANTPSIQDGMTQAEETEIRAKGVNFIVQVGIMLKLPQLTLSTAAIFFQRFLMRASLKKERDGIPKLHQYQAAATALFLATKVEESCRKMKELILAFCRVAQKNPNLIIDEQSKDWWRWRDCILHNEDVLLEVLCFDLTVESPHRQLFELLKFYGVEHNKRLRNAAWSFVTDSNNTQLCLLCNSRTIAMAGLYAACRYCDVALPDSAHGKPWWEAQNVKLPELKRAIEYMCASYDPASNQINGVSAGAGGSEGERSIYVGLLSPRAQSATVDDDSDRTRLKDEQAQDTQSPLVSQPPLASSERRLSNASSVGVKREREREEQGPSSSSLSSSQRVNGEHTNGVSRAHKENKRPRLEHDDKNETNGMHELVIKDSDPPGDLKHREEALRVQNGNRQDQQAAAAAAVMPPAPPNAGNAEGSEDGELDE